MDAYKQQPAAQRLPGREHVPDYPRGFIALRIVQLVFAIFGLGLAGFGVAFLVFGGDGLTLFTSIATVIVTVWLLVAHFSTPAAYNYWAVLALDIFLVFFWLVSFAVLAAQIAPFFAEEDDDSVFVYDDSVRVYLDILAAAAAVGGIEFMLFVISLAMHSVMVCRHRAAGLHNSPVRGRGVASLSSPPGYPVPPSTAGESNSGGNPNHHNSYPMQPAPVSQPHFQQQQQQQFQQYQEAPAPHDPSYMHSSASPLHQQPPVQFPTPPPQGLHAGPPPPGAPYPTA